jgi:rubrerythrin
MVTKGSRTEKNLLTAFMLESQARNLYTFFASQAEKEGYHQILRIYLEVADHERIHAKNFCRNLPGGKCELKVALSTSVVGSTLENLKFTCDEESEAHTRLYPEFAKAARDEGFEDIARLFLNVAIAEKLHEKRFRKLLKTAEEGKAWKGRENTIWVCSKCGFNIEGEEPPAKCPACQHPKEYFESFTEEV